MKAEEGFAIGQADICDCRFAFIIHDEIATLFHSENLSWWWWLSDSFLGGGGDGLVIRDS